MLACTLHTLVPIVFPSANWLRLRLLTETHCPFIKGSAVNFSVRDFLKAQVFGREVQRNLKIDGEKPPLWYPQFPATQWSLIFHLAHRSGTNDKKAGTGSSLGVSVSSAITKKPWRYLFMPWNRMVGRKKGKLSGYLKRKTYKGQEEKNVFKHRCVRIKIGGSCQHLIITT